MTLKQKQALLAIWATTEIIAILAKYGVVIE